MVGLERWLKWVSMLASFVGAPGSQRQEDFWEFNANLVYLPIKFQANQNHIMSSSLENEKSLLLLPMTHLGPHKHLEVRLSYLTTPSGPKDIYARMYVPTNE